MVKCIVYNDKLLDNLEPIVHFTIESFSSVATDEVTERVDSAGDLEEKLSSLRSPLFKDSTLFEDEPDQRVQEEVGCTNEGVSNST